MIFAGSQGITDNTISLRLVYIHSGIQTGMRMSAFSSRPSNMTECPLTRKHDHHLTLLTIRTRVESAVLYPKARTRMYLDALSSAAPAAEMVPYSVDFASSNVRDTVISPPAPSTTIISLFSLALDLVCSRGATCKTPTSCLSLGATGASIPTCENKKSALKNPFSKNQGFSVG